LIPPIYTHNSEIEAFEIEDPEIEDPEIEDPGREM
jgi:hypothetical protein